MTAIEFENISKQYRLGLVSTKTLAHDLNRFWQTRILGHEDPYLKIGETNDRSSRGSSEYVWALRDINFRVEQGDVVGIIGKNGAGKSTLLKLLSQVTGPTTGTIKARGRIGSLLEVGTGFHQEMTGRENIFLNGAILGMTRAEVQRKLDEIVDFSGCERYIDTPVKRYSSGMMVRLGFAVAAHLEPEILVVDEVLAVGDIEFQEKAIGKMQDVSRGEGRTILFVSHNMAAVKNLCKNGIVLKNGMIEHVGSAEECVDYYLGNSLEGIVPHIIFEEKHREDHHSYSREIEFIEAWLLNETPESIATDETLRIRILFRKNDRNKRNFQFCLFFQNTADLRVAFYQSKNILIPDTDTDTFFATIEINNHALPQGRYSIRMETSNQDLAKGTHPMDFVHHTLVFEVKYLHKSLKDEYLHWESEWGLRFHEDNGMQIKIE